MVTRNSILLSFLCLFLSMSSGGTIYVNGTSGNDSWAGTDLDFLSPNGPKSTIQAGIDAANNGDTVIVAQGTYRGLGNRDIDFGGKSIRLTSTDPNDAGIVEATVIDSEGTLEELHRGFYFHSGEGADSIVDGFTITNGQARFGGGIYCQASAPTIKNCVISNNTAYEKEETVIEFPGQDPIIDTRYYGEGGGISCSSGANAIIVNCKINNNSSYRRGGGIYCLNSAPTIKNCLITSNSADDFAGGGISCNTSDSVIESCTITDNIAGNRGGGIYSYKSDPTIKNCLITGNSSDEYGGGISCTGDYHTPKIINCTVSDNSTARGGAIDLITTTATISNCIFWNNTPSEITMTSTGTALVTHSNIEGGFSGTGNINSNPLFASGTNYRLLYGSPCIDKGTNSPPGGLQTTDLDGISRPFDGDYDETATTDMGAYEFHQNPGEPVLAASPSSFRFVCPQGGPAPASKTLSIWNSGGKLLRWQIEESCDWLEITPATGKSTGKIDDVSVSVDISGLSSDQYTYTVKLSDPCDINNTRYIPVILRVGPTLLVPDQYGTIQAAVDASFDGDEIIVADGTYTGNGNRDIDYNGKAITVRSANGPANCIIDCQGTSSNPHRGFYFHSSEGSDSILEGFTITNGYCTGSWPMSEGGGIFCLNQGTDPTIKNCIVKGNTAMSGGGISLYRSSAMVMNCTVTDNNASYDKGGGILCWEGSYPTIQGCTISNNQAKYNTGGIYCYNSPTIMNCIVWGNTQLNGTATQIQKSGLGHPQVSYCNVEGGYSGVGNINVDPDFIDAANGNYHLHSYSACVDAGDPNYSPGPDEMDIDGEKRVMGGVVDIGSDEISDMESDFNDSGAVDLADLSEIFKDWDSTEGTPGWDAEKDLSKDGTIGVVDFALLANRWLSETDTEQPSVPNNLEVSAVTVSTVSLIWNESTDNVGVAGYKVYRNGEYIGWTKSNSYTNIDLEPSTIYFYTVRAYDNAYNESEPSNSCRSMTEGD